MSIEFDDLSDEDLEQIAGGKGSFNSYYCDVAESDEIFANYLGSGSLNNCPDWLCSGNPTKPRRCTFCDNFKFKLE